MISRRNELGMEDEDDEEKKKKRTVERAGERPCFVSVQVDSDREGRTNKQPVGTTQREGDGFEEAHGKEGGSDRLPGPVRQLAASRNSV